MPNWTENTIKLTGEPEDIRAFLEAVKWEDRLFDFNRIIPMPEILKHTGKGFRTIDGERVESWYIITDGEFLEQAVRRFTPEEEALLDEIGHRDWYSWSIENWGTKWNACRPEIDTTELCTGSAEVRFETAWDAPTPVFHKVFELFPKLSVICIWEHEGQSTRHLMERRRRY